MSQTVLITGATGLLGRQIQRAFQDAGWNAVGTGFSRAEPPKILKLDLCNASEIVQTLDQVKPSVIIHSAAQRFPDKVDKDPSAARTLNIDATKALASAAAERNIFLLYISTDYVFPGKPGEAPYESTAAPAPTNLYGQTKLDGEQALLEATKATCLGAVLRVPVLYGQVNSNSGNAESAVNVLMDQLKKAQDGTKVVMDDWSIRYPTNTADVGRVCHDIAAKFIAAGSAEGRAALPQILQFSGEERFTKYQICEVFADIMGWTMGGMVANKEGNDPNASVQRPYDTHLSTKALKDLGVSIIAQDFRGWWRMQVGAYRH